VRTTFDQADTEAVVAADLVVTVGDDQHGRGALDAPAHITQHVLLAAPFAAGWHPLPGIPSPPLSPQR